MNEAERKRIEADKDRAKPNSNPHAEPNAERVQQIVSSQPNLKRRIERLREEVKSTDLMHTM